MHLEQEFILYLESKGKPWQEEGHEPIGLQLMHESAWHCAWQRVSPLSTVGSCPSPS